MAHDDTDEHDGTQGKGIVGIRLRLLLRRTAVALAEAGRFIVSIVPEPSARRSGNSGEIRG
jgi:hypothetical protein